MRRWFAFRLCLAIRLVVVDYVEINRNSLSILIEKVKELEKSHLNFQINLVFYYCYELVLVGLTGIHQSWK